MGAEFFFSVLAASLLSNGLAVLYFYSLNAITKAERDGMHPRWGVIIGALVAPAICAGAIYFTVIP